ncbi:MAG: urea carboxylase-associated family protein [Pararhodobacter sp.]
MPPRTPAETPLDAEARRAIAPVICYPVESLPQPDLALYSAARATARAIHQATAAPRDAVAFRVAAGQFFRICCPQGSQVGDLNLFNATNPDERFFSGKTRALHGTHVGIGARLWSSLPWLRPMATVTADTLAWYGTDAFGGRVHDVIGTRCDPHTHHLLSGGEMYHHCCHSNLTRALVGEGFARERAEMMVHDVLNVFMCTGFTADTGQYFMKASPARQGDYIEFFAEIDLLGVLSACPGGDCGDEHSSDSAQCHPLSIEVFAPEPGALAGWQSPAPSGYDRSHGLPMAAR